MNVVIVGAGKLGQKVTESLIDGNYEITVIDKNEATLTKMSQSFDIMTVNEDARQISVLESIDIDNCDYLLTSTGNDEVNILIAGFAKRLGCRHVIACVREPEHMNQFDFIKDTLDIDTIVNPDMSITLEIYKYLAEKITLSGGVFTAGKTSIIEFPVNRFPSLAGLTIPDVRSVLPNMIVAAISRKGKIIIPHGNDEIMRGDSIYLLGEQHEIQELNRKVSVKTPSSTVSKVMIVGGGKTGFYLAKRMSDFGAAVKLIERDLTRCHYLSTHLKNVMVLHGDATDISLLEEENLEDMDAFVTATGYDEDNLLLALTAKNKGVEDVISKVSHESYKDLVEKMGVDMVLNPLDITASAILRYIQGTKRIISSTLLQGQAEIMEIIADNSMAVVGKPLEALDLPREILIAAIHRGNQLIIPNGRTRIQNNDRIIVLCLLTGLAYIEKLMKTKR